MKKKKKKKKKKKPIWANDDVTPYIVRTGYSGILMRCMMTTMYQEKRFVGQKEREGMRMIIVLRHRRVL
jgi:hypothetical protein